MFCTTNINKDSIYCDVKDRICNFLNKFLYETLFLQPLIKFVVVDAKTCINFTRMNRSRLTLAVTKFHPDGQRKEAHWRGYWGILRMKEYKSPKPMKAGPQ